MCPRGLIPRLAVLLSFMLNLKSISAIRAFRPMSRRKFPREHDATHFDRPAPVALGSAAFGYNDCPIAVQFRDRTAVEQPQQSEVINAGKRPIPIAAEQIERPPTECRCACGPSAVEETAVERSLYHRAVGYSHDAVKILTVARGDGRSEVVQVPYVEHYPPDTTAAIFFLKNRRPDRWRDTQNIDHAVGVYHISDSPIGN